MSTESETGCEHVSELREYLARAGLVVWSEHGEDPPGWLNVHCEKCKRTFEIALRQERT